MLLCYMGIETGVIYTHITTVTALVLGEYVTAVLTAKLACIVADVAECNIVRTITAIVAKMLVIFGVHNAHTVRAIGVTLTAIKADSAKFALLYVTERSAAIGADVVKPLALFDAVFAAVATL